MDLDQVEAKSEDIKESIAYLAALLPEWSRPVGSRPRALQIQNTWTQKHGTEEETGFIDLTPLPPLMEESSIRWRLTTVKKPSPIGKLLGHVAINNNGSLTRNSFSGVETKLRLS